MGIAMIKAEKLSYSFPQKDLYNNISFTLEDDVHCAFIGTNGTGKSTLVDMILHPDNYLYEGKLTVEVPGRIGYVSQFYSVEDEPEMTVFDYLSDEFVRLQGEINRICDEMATAEDFEEVMEHYQKAMDEFQAIDGDFYESNIRKQLKLANLQDYENHLLTNLSGGEFKLVQVIREMMVSPKFVIMDEPDVFLDFEHLNALKNLINAHKGTLLVITHNRYLLNHCFNKILHLENAEIQEFDGTYIEYNFAMLQMKIEQQELDATSYNHDEDFYRISLKKGNVYNFYFSEERHTTIVKLLGKNSNENETWPSTDADRFCVAPGDTFVAPYTGDYYIHVYNYAFEQYQYTTKVTNVKLDKTSIKSLKSGKSSMNVKWKKVKCNGYQLQYSTRKNFKGAKTLSFAKNSTSASIKKLSSKKKYYVRIRTCFSVKDGKKAYSGWSKSKCIKVK